MGKFSEALQEAGEPPCTKFVCTSQARCAERKIACYAFFWYVKTGRSISPLMVRDGWDLRRTRRPVAVSSLYRHIFAGDDEPDEVVGLYGARAGRSQRPRGEVAA